MSGRVAWMAIAVLLAGCGGSSVRLQDLLALPPSDAGAAGAGTQTGSVSTRTHEPQEASALVEGTPTSVFAEVARGALGCWFAVDGPLKASHVYRAEAEPPSKGGDAEIIVYERDATMRDLRGPRAYRIGFVAELNSVRVTMTSLRFEPKLAQAMAKDVESWAKGADSCQLRVMLPPPAPPVASKTPKAAKTAKTAKGQQSTSKTDPTAGGKKR